MASVYGFLVRNYNVYNPPVAVSTSGGTESPLRFGILGAAVIAPVALINPARSHPDVQVYAVAARDVSRAEAFAKRHDIPVWYGGKSGYQALIDDPKVDVIYNPLPNTLHYEWTMKALMAGKHVLLEKPSSNTADETRRMFELAESKGLVLLEAFHYRFHPSIQRVKEIINSGELGALQSISASFAFPKGIITSNDIRMNYDLGGGALMDTGSYTLDCIRFLASSNPIAVLDANSTCPPDKPLIDSRTSATLSFPSATGSPPIVASIVTDFALPPHFGFIPRRPDIGVRAVCERGSVEMFNFFVPMIYHSITVHPEGRPARIEKAYTFGNDMLGKKGEEWWTTYRYQLEAFVDRVRGQKPQTWLDKEDSVCNMEWIEKIYEKTGLPSRPRSQFQLDTPVCEDSNLQP